METGLDLRIDGYKKQYLPVLCLSHKVTVQQHWLACKLLHSWATIINSTAFITRNRNTKQFKQKRGINTNPIAERVGMDMTLGTTTPSIKCFKSFCLHFSSLLLSEYSIYSFKLPYLTEWSARLPATPYLYPNSSKNKGPFLLTDI